jgi:hypothetical protein
MVLRPSVTIASSPHHCLIASTGSAFWVMTSSTLMLVTPYAICWQCRIVGGCDAGKLSRCDKWHALPIPNRSTNRRETNDRCKGLKLLRFQIFCAFPKAEADIHGAGLVH